MDKKSVIANENEKVFIYLKLQVAIKKLED
jgi:hypothetical protein